jgi:hypothetical protein
MADMLVNVNTSEYSTQTAHYALEKENAQSATPGRMVLQAAAISPRGGWRRQYIRCQSLAMNCENDRDRAATCQVNHEFY